MKALMYLLKFTNGRTIRLKSFDEIMDLVVDWQWETLPKITELSGELIGFLTKDGEIVRRGVVVCQLSC